jgi:phosphate acetyltransferase
MTLLDKIAALAKKNRRHIVLSEGEDERVVNGGLQAATDGLAKITFIGDRQAYSALSSGKPGAELVDIVSPSQSPHLNDFVDCYVDLRRHKGVTAEEAREAMLHPLGFAAMMVRQGQADGTIGGAAYTTAETVRNAIQIIGKGPDVPIVSSFFLMVLDRPDGERPVVFADCALVVLPTVDELASIAVSSSESFERLVGETPKTAMLAFSTQGSSQDERLDRVVDAAEIARQRQPSLIIDGELQFDAAFEPSVSEMKAPDSPLKGEANVFIFPNLHAGNIGYKIAQRIGGATAIGPILQGLAKPANDLSRGCTSDDVYYMIAVTAVQAAQAG